MLNKFQRGNLLFTAVLLVLSLFGIAALSWGTRFGLGLVNDSYAYVIGAENLDLGNGYTRTSGAGELKPITHFPPLYSILIDLFRIPGFDFLQTAHAINVVLFGLDIAMVGWLVYLMGQSKGPALFAAFLFALSDAFLPLYALLLSEALFITLMMAVFLVLWKFVQKQNHVWLLFCGIFAGMTYLTRFAGISLIITLLLIFVGTATNLKRFLWQSLPFLVGAAPFFLGWMLTNINTSGNFSNRILSIHLVPFNKLFEALKNLLTWVALDDLMHAHSIFGWVLSGLSLLLLPALTIWVARWFWLRKRNDPMDNISGILPITLALHILVYFSFLIFTVSFFDASTPFDDRILSIIYIPELILLAIAGGWLTKKIARQRKWLINSVTGLGLLFLLFSGWDGLRQVEQLGRDGLGFNHSGWKNSPGIQYIRSMSPIILYSNRPTAIYLLTGRYSYIIPTVVDPVTTRNRSTYPSDLEIMRDQVLAGEALLVLFQEKNDLGQDDDTAELAQGLKLIADLSDATIYGKP